MQQLLIIIFGLGIFYVIHRLTQRATTYNSNIITSNYTPEPIKSIYSDGMPHIYCAGFQYHDGPKIKHKLIPDTLLQLVPDIDNEEDSSAIKIMLGKYHLGFIPREMTVYIPTDYDHSLPDDAEYVEFVTDNVKAYIKNFDPYEKKSFYKLSITVYVDGKLIYTPYHSY